MTHARRTSSLWRSEKQVAKEVKSDLRVAKKWRLPWWGVLCVIIGSMPMFLLFDRFGRLNMALPLLNSIAVLGLAIGVKWSLRRNAWFWITMGAIAALHALLILAVPWTDKWVPAAAYAGAASLDLVVILLVLAIVEKLVGDPEAIER